MDEYVSIEQARPKLGELVDRARLAGDHLVIARNGRPAAVIVPLDWYDDAREALAPREAP